MLAGNLTLTWQPTTMLTQSLWVRFFESEGDRRLLLNITGTSPLALPLDSLNLTANARLQTYILPAANQVGGAQVLFAAGQPISLSGTVLSRPT
ncbi:MAG: hypothetical protein AABX89_00530 [Candidatus Thermoplasmatota archaeon]